MQAENFEKLFNEFRLKSQLETLSDLGMALAEEGIVYEDSTFSHWKNGNRIPKKRHVILALLRVFIKRQGILELADANSFLQSVGLSDLTEEEFTALYSNLLYKFPFNVPDEIRDFIPREKLFQQISWSIFSDKTTLLYGMPGSGKTAIAIKIAHILKDRFSDGILWYRMDTTNFEDVLNGIAETYGKNIVRLNNISVKIEYIKNLIAKKKLLLILDNVEDIESIKEVFLTSSKREYSILLTSIQKLEDSNILKKINIPHFLKNEAITFSSKILGDIYVATNFNKLNQLYKLIAYSPLGLNVLLKQIKVNPKLLSTFITTLRKEKLNLLSLEYDNKTIVDSFEISYSLLSEEVKNIFDTLGIFGGADFPIAAVAKVNNISLNKAEIIFNELNAVSLVEKSSLFRYRLHPLVKFFCLSKKQTSQMYENLSSYYLELLESKIVSKQKKILQFEIELENIFNLLNKLNSYQAHENLINLWNCIEPILWDSGRLAKVEEYAFLLIEICVKKNDYANAGRFLIQQLSIMYYWQGEIEKAQRTLKRGLLYAKKLKRLDLIASGNKINGLLYHLERNYNQAKKYLIKAIKQFTFDNTLTELADAYIYLGNVYTEEHKFKQATECYEKSLDYGRGIPEHSSTAIAYYYMGDMSLIKKNTEEAQSYFKLSYDIDIVRKRIPGIAHCHYGFARVYALANDVQKAYTSYIRARELFEQLGMFQLVTSINSDIYRLKHQIQYKKIPKIIHS